MQLQPEVVNDVVLACCALHNFMRTKSSDVLHDTENCDFVDQLGSDGPVRCISHESRVQGAKYNTAAKEIRDKLASYFTGSGQVSWQWKHGNVAFGPDDNYQ